MRAARRGRGWSQRQLARLSGISRGAIQNLERGRTRIPHPETLYVLAKSLRVDVTELLADLATHTTRSPRSARSVFEARPPRRRTAQAPRPTPRLAPDTSARVVLARLDLTGGSSWIPIVIAHEAEDGPPRLDLEPATKLARS